MYPIFLFFRHLQDFYSNAEEVHKVVMCVRPYLHTRKKTKKNEENHQVKFTFWYTFRIFCLNSVKCLKEKFFLLMW